MIPQPLLGAADFPVLITESGFDHTRSLGYEIGNEVVRALKEKSIVDYTTDIQVNSQFIDIPVTGEIHKLLNACRQKIRCQKNFQRNT